MGLSPKESMEFISELTYIGIVLYGMQITKIVPADGKDYYFHKSFHWLIDLICLSNLKTVHLTLRVTGQLQIKA